MDEYGLIEALRATDNKAIPKAPLIEPLILFRTHFVLFHTLYKLRERLWREQRGHLQINPLNISLQPYRPGNTGVATYDPLRDYYSDLSRLETTSVEDIKELLGKFWSKFHASEQRQEALSVLALRDPVDFPTIKRQYRRLAMRHHPDRGGSRERLQEINAAMATLAAYYR